MLNSTGKFTNGVIVMYTEKKKQVWGFGVTLMGILLCMGILCLNTYRENHKDKVLTYAESNDTGADCTITIQPRGGSKDSWIKHIGEKGFDGKTKDHQYAGVIYDIIITNRTDKDIKDWSLKIPVPGYCYVNNAWCGTLELHQNVGRDEKIQTIDTRKWYENPEQFTVQAIMIEPDLMIPMNKGDYFVYIPSEDADECVIKASSADMDFYHSKNVGVIIYTDTVDEKIEPLEFSGIEIKYHLYKNIFDSVLFRVMLVFLIIWCLSLAITCIVGFKTNRLLAQTERDAQIIEQSMSAFMGFIDAKDPSTTGHSRRVAMYAKKLAQRMGFDTGECERVYYIGLMHDCGKIGIPDAVLKKPGKLTSEEYEIIKTHTTQGEKILQDFTSIEGIKEGALYHHERYDGRGYPTGLKGEEIPLIARIICVADSFDVMNSERCYKNKLTKDDIIEQMQTNRGTQFDPEIVDYFMDMLMDGTIEF